MLGGVLIGIVGALFRLALAIADERRNALVALAHTWPYAGWLAPIFLGMVGAAVARFLVVRFAPEAEGSGVQRVEAAFSGEADSGTRATLPVKFFGGIAAIGSGLALGREGPTVHMGSALAERVSRFFVKGDDGRIVAAAGAGAGLAVAFNAPIGGSVFVFEEVAAGFSPALVINTLATCATAVWIMRLILGNHFDFIVRQGDLSMRWDIWPFLVLGILLGAMGALYNALVIHLLRVASRITRLSSVQRAALIGAVVGLVAWFRPALVGGGDNITQDALSGTYAVQTLAIVFGLRFLLGPWSYAAGTPGGLFAPILVLGTSFGALYGEVMHHFDPGLGVTALACAVVGMSSLFTACVRAPMTGILLTVEMTGRGDLTLGLLSGSLMAMVVAMLLRSPPIYESLKRRMLSAKSTSTHDI